MVRHSAFLECKHVFEQVISGYVELFFIMPARKRQPQKGFAAGARTSRGDK